MKKAMMRAGRKVQSKNPPDGDVKEPPPEIDMSLINGIPENEEPEDQEDPNIARREFFA